MRSVSKVILLGNLTRNPEIKQTEGKKPVCIFGLATNRSWTTEIGEKREEPEFHRIIAWNKWAEVCNQYLTKGRKVYMKPSQNSLFKANIYVRSVAESGILGLVHRGETAVPYLHWPRRDRKNRSRSGSGRSGVCSHIAQGRQGDVGC